MVCLEHFSQHEEKEMEIVYLSLDKITKKNKNWITMEKNAIILLIT